jgi:hypothetical protein
MHGTVDIELHHAKIVDCPTMLLHGKYYAILPEFELIAHINEESRRQQHGNQAG